MRQVAVVAVVAVGVDRTEFECFAGTSPGSLAEQTVGPDWLPVVVVVAGTVAVVVVD